jgi:hypothetical protein
VNLLQREERPMRARTFGAGLLLGGAALGLGAPVALAGTTDENPEPYLAAPSEPLAAGQELLVQGYCPDPAAGPLSSAALTDIEILHDPEAGPPNLNASGVVRDGTAPGGYPVTMDCAGRTLSVTMTVVDPTHDLPADYLRIDPGTARPGATVAAQASCVDTDEAVLSSPVLRTATLAPHPEGHQPWALHGTTTVAAGAEPGNYPVSAACGSGVVQTTITVLGETGGTAGGDRDEQVTRVPKGAPETGAGPRGFSVPMLMLGVLGGAVVTAAAITWREVR